MCQLCVFLQPSSGELSSPEANSSSLTNDSPTQLFDSEQSDGLLDAETPPLTLPTSKNYKPCVQISLGICFAIVLTVLARVAIKHISSKPSGGSKELYSEYWNGQKRDIEEIKSLLLETLDSKDNNKLNGEYSAGGKESIV